MLVKSILFICSGNTCRSIIAEGVCKKILNEKGLNKVNISSAGVHAICGLKPSFFVTEILKKQGIDLTSYQSKMITQKEINSADLILTMTDLQKEELKKISDFSSNKIFVFKDYLNFGDEIEDPIGKGQEKYESCIQKIIFLINLLIEKLTIKIAIGSDHGGFKLKEYLIENFKGTFLKLQDFGTNNLDSVDYSDIALKIIGVIKEDKFQKGILICTTGLGMSIVANRFSHIRAAACCNTFMAKLSRMHNDANILVLGEKVVEKELAKEILEVWLNTPFENEERHQRRIEKLNIKGKT